MNIENIKSIFEILASVSTILGVPIAIFLFFKDKNRERLERESSVYDSLDQWYSEFIKISFENKDLAAIYYSKYLLGVEKTQELTEDQKIRQLLYFEMLTSILERAFLIYRDQNNSMKTKRWNGWNEYMIDWMGVSQYREVWGFIGQQWDEDFVAHMNKILKQVESEITIT